MVIKFGILSNRQSYFDEELLLKHRCRGNFANVKKGLEK